jgi:hypothetical protein
VDERTKGGIARIDDVGLFCLWWSLDGALILTYRWPSVRGAGGVRVSAPWPCRIPDVANVLGCLMLYLWT